MSQSEKHSRHIQFWKTSGIQGQTSLRLQESGI